MKMYGDYGIPTTEELAAWKDLYKTKGSETDSRHNNEDTYPATTFDPLLTQIRQIELLCNELDRLRSVLIFANIELTELLHLRTLSVSESKQKQCNRNQSDVNHPQSLSPTEQRVNDIDGEVFYRIAVPEDAQELSDFAKKTFTDTFFVACGYSQEDLDAYLRASYEPEHWIERMNCHDKYMIVARSRNSIDSETGAYVRSRILGYMLAAGPMDLPCASLSAAEKARSGELVKLYVCPTVFGKGVAQRLMHAGLQWLLKHYPGDVFLSVWSQNYRAQKFYQKYGGHLVDTYKYAVGNSLDEEWVYRLPRADIVARLVPGNADKASSDSENVPKKTIVTSSTDELTVQEADAALRLFEVSKLHPILHDLVALKASMFADDYRRMEAVLQIHARKQALQPTKDDIAQDILRCLPSDTSDEEPHHALFLEHLGMLGHAFLLCARITELRGLWSDSATLYRKVIEHMVYSGRYSDQVGVSELDMQLRARSRRAINALCAAPQLPAGSSQPTSGLINQAHPRRRFTPLGTVGNADICVVRSQCAQALFSCGCFAESNQMANEALRGLALVIGAEAATIGAIGGMDLSRGMTSESAFRRSHSSVLSRHETLQMRLDPMSLFEEQEQSSRIRIPFDTSISLTDKARYLEAYQQALAITRFLSKMPSKQ